MKIEIKELHNYKLKFPLNISVIFNDNTWEAEIFEPFYLLGFGENKDSAIDSLKGEIELLYTNLMGDNDLSPKGLKIKEFAYQYEH